MLFNRKNRKSITLKYCLCFSLFFTLLSLTAPQPADGSSTSTGLSKGGPGYANVKTGIAVRYGNHTYGVDSQKEYDEVMKKVDALITKLSTPTEIRIHHYEEYFLSYINGTAKWNGSYSRDNDENYPLWLAEKTIGELVKNSKIPKDDLLKLIYLSDIASGYLSDLRLKDGEVKTTYSALHTLKGLRDSDAYSQLLSAIFDAAGYNTMIYANNESYYVQNGKRYLSPWNSGIGIKLGGKWYTYEYGSFIEKEMPVTTIKKVDYYIHTKPTYLE